MTLKTTILDYLDDHIKHFFKYSSSPKSSEIFEKFHPILMDFYGYQCDIFERELSNGITHEKEGVFLITFDPHFYSHEEPFNFIVFGDSVKAFLSIQQNSKYDIKKLDEASLTKHLLAYLNSNEPENHVTIFNNNLVFENLSPEKQAIVLKDFEKLNGTNPIGFHLLNILNKANGLRNLTFSLQNIGLFIDNTTKKDNELIKNFFTSLHHDPISSSFNPSTKKTKNLGFFQISNNHNFSLLNYCFKNNELTTNQQIELFQNILYAFSNIGFTHYFLSFPKLELELSDTIISLIPSLDTSNYFSFNSIFETIFFRNTFKHHDTLDILSKQISKSFTPQFQEELLARPNLSKYFKKSILMSKIKNEPPPLDLQTRTVTELIINRSVTNTFPLIGTTMKNLIDSIHEILNKLDIPSVVFVEDLASIKPTSLNNNSSYALRVFLDNKYPPETIVSFISKILNDIDNRVRDSYIKSEDIKNELREFYLISQQPTNLSKKIKAKI